MKSYKHHYFPKVSDQNWHDYHWQYRHSIRGVDALREAFTLSEAEEEFFASTEQNVPLLITPYYLSLINPQDMEDPIRKTVLPRIDELHTAKEELLDPLGEEDLSPVPGLVHRYPDRVLFLVTAFCSTYCRYCTRSRMVGNFSEYKFPKDQWDGAIAYIKSNKTIKDVLISGGDPLTLPNEHLDYLICELSKIDHLSLIRLGTKIPTVLPQRVDRGLVEVLTSYKPVWLSVHFSHPNELHAEVRDACRMLSDAGIPLMSQTVLLKQVNDDIETLKELFYGLVSIKVKPYYLLHCDLIRGSSHFRTRVEDDLKLMKGLHGHISGYAVPKYVIDLPHGKGKYSPMELPVQSGAGSDISITNYLGEQISFPL